METIIIAAGFGPRADGTGGLRGEAQDDAIYTLHNAIDRAGCSVSASIVGTSSGGDWAPEDGIWFAVTLPECGEWKRNAHVFTLRNNLRDWCQDNGQDAIALTVRGQTEFVSA